MVRIVSGISLATNFIPGSTSYINQKVDTFVRNRFGLGGTSLAECNAPVVERKNLSFEETMDVLNDTQELTYKFNPAHCTQQTVDTSKLPQSTKYEEFMTLFNTYDWEKKYVLIKGKFMYDERFLDAFTKYFSCEIKDIRENFDFYVSQMATKENLTKESYLAKKIKGQMQILVSQMQGDLGVPLQGSSADFFDGLDNCKILLPYLKAKGGFLLEDALLKLAVEAGGYCTRAFQRVSNELVTEMLHHVAMDNAVNNNQTEMGPLELYQLKVRVLLQDKRMESIQYKALSIINSIRLNPVNNDVHLQDAYRTVLSMGFYPVTKQESYRSGLTLLFLIYFFPYRQMRESIFTEYSQDIKSIFNDNLVNGDFWLHLPDLIDANPSLSDDQKETIKEKIAENIVGENARARHKESCIRLLYVMMGIYKKVA